MQISTEFGEVFGSDKVSYETVRSWRKKFVTSTESVKDAAKSGQPCTMTGQRMPEIIKSNGIYMIRDIVQAIGISQPRVNIILRYFVNKKLSARWIHYILTDD